jgi:hypothetical protein
MQLRLHVNEPTSKPRSQEWTAPSDTVETAFLQPATEAFEFISERQGTDFNARWFDLPQSVDLNNEFDTQHNNYVAEQEPKDQMYASWLVAADAKADPPHRTRGAVGFGSVFLAGALSILLFGGALKLICAWLPLRPSGSADEPNQPNLSELLRALRLADEALKSQRSNTPPAGQSAQLFRDQTISKRRMLVAVQAPTATSAHVDMF